MCSLQFPFINFNHLAGSELAINSRAVNAFIVTNMTACSGGIVWMLTEMIIKRTRKMSLYGFCCGAVAGLVAITPGAGYVSPKSSLAFGFTSI